MKYINKITLTLIICLMCFTSVISHAKYAVDEFGIENIDVPEDYISCSRTECDPELEVILQQNGFATLEDWNNAAMITGQYYVFARHSDNRKAAKSMYLKCEKVESPKTKDGLVEHFLACDYNLAETVVAMDDIIDDTNIAAATNDAEWITVNPATPYVEYTTGSAGAYMHVYETIYGGNKFTLFFTSDKIFSEEEKQMHSEILASLKHSDTVVYTEGESEKVVPYSEELENLKSLINSANQKKLEEESNTGKNTRILWYIIGVLVALIIAFSIYMAIRSHSKKRKKVIVLREHEVTDDDGDRANSKQQ